MSLFSDTRSLPPTPAKHSGAMYGTVPAAPPAPIVRYVSALMREMPKLEVWGWGWGWGEIR
jgi:hypothetical protein